MNKEEMIAMDACPETVTIFISQRMNGKTDAAISTYRHRVMECLSKKFDGCVSFSLPLEPLAYSPVYMLGESLQQLDNCDLAAFPEDWHEARGCAIEWLVCEKYGIPTILMNKTGDKILTELTAEDVVKKARGDDATFCPEHFSSNRSIHNCRLCISNGLII